VTQHFPETRWSQLLDLRDPAHPKYAEHLERLASQYWKPVYHYARALRKVSPGDAEDLTQQFFAMLLARRDLAKLSPDRGSFRGFLKTALRNFLASADRVAGARPQLFRYPEAEATWKDDGALPEEAFDREWVRSVLHDAIARLRQELEKQGKARIFDLFREHCLEETGRSYGELARVHVLSEDDVRNRLRETRQRVREILEELLRDYLAPGQSVEDELRFILSK
jgi:RNA polymerase sigma factor (sigma-70 family)